MPQVTIIPAKPQLGNRSSTEEIKKLRVAAYCRVSTDTEEQETSYEAQVEHYKYYIKAHPEWTFAGIYADDGISGTNTKKREEFNRMIEACMAGDIDMIITKSISRFARNTLDCLTYIRQLKEQNIAVLFEKESINTLDAKGEVLLTIMASLAQQESQSLSQNVKLGIQYRYQQGKVQINHKHFLGYTKDTDGNLIIDPEQAQTVKRIFREFLDGKSPHSIAKGLQADGISNGAGKTKWWESNIRQILSNEKYMGDALLQKTVTTDFLTKTRVKNTGQAQQYYVENNHEAIIPKDIFLLAQEELIKRSKSYLSPAGIRRNYSSQHPLSQKVICAECGDLFRRIHWNNRGKKSVVWRCISRLEAAHAHMVCHARTVHEDELKAVCTKALNMLLASKQDFIDQLTQNLEHAIQPTTDMNALEIDKQLKELQQQLIGKVQQKQDYAHIAEQIHALMAQKADIEQEQTRTSEHLMRMNELKSFIQKQTLAITDFDETLVRRLIESILIEDEGYTVAFKSGTSLHIN
ncbi:recombinase family protein [Collinsella sp. zg1085]|uniref:recombinase family protein n=1 Tax=Collinsella sp. zg1085 TaxID=2844380 RepID=UPI001C0AA40A|nr:recombinase family protein [Collinsella sp. zg1085]QWT17702.1 recombinase family protein [Collinsella sp. zg1085]